MRIRDLLSEAKAAIPPKPRNFVAKNAINTGAGQHKDKKRAEKQGDVKHKKQVEPAEDVAEGASLKKAKREYNQAAKDAGGDWAGAGKKIDNMKKGLRQKDVGKEKEVAEISDNTLKNYRQGAHTQVQGAKFGKGKGTPEAEKIIAKREKGMAAAGQRQQARRDAAKAKQPPREIPKTSSGPQDWYGQNRYMGDSVEQGVAEGLNENLQADDGEYYSNSDDFFSQFESDWFDKEETSPDGMEIRGYIDGVNVMAWRFKSAKKIGGWGIYDDSALRQGVAEGYDTVMSIVGTSDWNMRGWKIKWGETDSYNRYKKMYQGIVNKDGIHPDMGRTGAHFVVFTPINTGDTEVENKKQAIELDFDSRVEVFDPNKNDWVWLDTEIKPADTSKDYGSSRPSKSGWQKPSKYGWTDYNPEESVAEGFPKDPNAPKLVRDRKTGKQYDPNKEFEKKMTSPDVMAQMKRMAKKEGVAESESNAMSDTAKRLTNKDDGKVAKLRAAGDKRREDELKGRNIAKRNESVDLKTSLQESKKDVVGSSYSIFKIK